jgi:hypothetical protein
METLQTVVDVLKREADSASDLGSLEQRLHGLQTEAASQALELAEARLKLGAEAARNAELRQQISSLGETWLSYCKKKFLKVSHIMDKKLLFLIN